MKGYRPVVPARKTAGTGGSFTEKCPGARVAGKRIEEFQAMKSREGGIRLKRFQVEDRRRQVAQIEAMILEFDRMAKELNDQVLAEQERSGLHDAGHFAYPTFAKAATQRRDNLAASERALKDQLAAARAAYDEAAAELQKAEAIAERDLAHDKSGGHKAEQRAAS
jgi:hypothetical protein